MAEAFVLLSHLTMFPAFRKIISNSYGLISSGYDLVCIFKAGTMKVTLL